MNFVQTHIIQIFPWIFLVSAKQTRGNVWQPMPRLNAILVFLLLLISLAASFRLIQPCAYVSLVYSLHGSLAGFTPTGFDGPGFKPVKHNTHTDTDTLEPQVHVTWRGTFFSALSFNLLIADRYVGHSSYFCAPPFCEGIFLICDDKNEQNSSKIRLMKIVSPMGQGKKKTLLVLQHRERFPWCL